MNDDNNIENNKQIGIASILFDHLYINSQLRLIDEKKFND